jgi:hypothetical protein
MTEYTLMSSDVQSYGKGTGYYGVEMVTWPMLHDRVGEGEERRDSVEAYLKWWKDMFRFRSLCHNSRSDENSKAQLSRGK